MPSARQLAIFCIMAFISVRQRVSKSQRGCRYHVLLTYSYQPRVKVFLICRSFFRTMGCELLLYFLTRNGESDLDMTVVLCGRPTHWSFESEPRVNQMDKLRAMSPTLHRYGSCLNATSWQLIDKRYSFGHFRLHHPTFPTTAHF